MRKQKNNEIPRSILRGSGFICTDLRSEAGEKLLFINPQCAVVGIEDEPYLLFVTPEFDDKILPLNLKGIIYKVKRIVLQPTFLDKMLDPEYYSIPIWLTDFKELEHLSLKSINVDNLIYLHDLPVKYLELSKVFFSDKDRILTAISYFSCLKELVYDETAPLNIIRSLKELNSGLKLTEKFVQ